jgi:hypothetical protein
MSKVGCQTVWRPARHVESAPVVSRVLISLFRAISEQTRETRTHKDLWFADTNLVARRVAADYSNNV